MGKIIRMSNEDIETTVAEFREALYENPMVSNGKVSFTKTFNNSARVATIHFTELAYLKMTQLIEKFDKEIAWHGVAFRDEDESKDDYYISDILVYPQEVTGATVTTDQDKYTTWLYCHDDDVFNNIRFQGHSHVRMAVTPSGTDNLLYERLIEKMTDDDFYIFGIWNKNYDRNVFIYDMKKNMVFDNDDVIIDVSDGNVGILSFLKEAKDMVKQIQYTPTYQNIYGSYGSYHGQNVQSLSPAPAPETATSKPSTPVTPASGAGLKMNTVKKKKKRVDPDVARIALFGSRANDNDDEDDGYDDSPYSAFGHT